MSAPISQMNRPETVLKIVLRIEAVRQTVVRIHFPLAEVNEKLVYRKGRYFKSSARRFNSFPVNSLYSAIRFAAVL